MSVDFLLLDEKDSIIQGSIHHQWVERFKDSLTEGAIFMINDFDIVRSNTRYKLIDHPFMIRFTNQTTIVQVENEKYSIQLEKFRVRSYDDLLELADKNQDLPDVTGLICTIKKPELDEEGPAKKVELRLLLEEGVRVRVTIWEDLTKAFCAKLDEIEEKRIMIIVTSINPKIFGGELYLNSTSSTKFYLNAEFDIVRDFHRRINMEEQLSEIHKSSGASVCDKQQCCSISDIFAFLSTEEAQ